MSKDQRSRLLALIDKCIANPDFVIVLPCEVSTRTMKKMVRSKLKAKA